MRRALQGKSGSDYWTVRSKLLSGRSVVAARGIALNSQLEWYFIKLSHKSAGVVKRFGEHLVPRLYQHLNPMPYAKAKEMEVILADSLRKRGYVVYGGH